MSWTVNFYPKETGKFLDGLTKTERSDFGQEFEIIENYGFSRPNPALKKMAGLPNVWELKIKQYRMFLILFGQTFQVLGTLTKKSNKTPRETMALIKQRAKNFGGKV